MNYSRKKSASQSSSNFSNNKSGQRNNKSRFSGGGQNNNNSNRPRKNYGAMREKYLTQARDALSAGDRVLAENYFQHADHCFRMIAEENASRPQRVHVPHGQQAAENIAETVDNVSENSEGDDSISTNVTSLPAFLTANYEAPKKEGEPVVQNWEDRDEI